MVRKIILIAYNGVTVLDLVGPMQVFSTATGYSKATTGVKRYELVVASVDGGVVATSTGLQIVTQPLHEICREQIDTIIVPGGRPNDNTVFDTRLVAWIAENGPSSRRVCSANAPVRPLLMARSSFTTATSGVRRGSVPGSILRCIWSRRITAGSSR